MTEERSNHKRDKKVVAQYRTTCAAADYADAYRGSGPAARYFRSRLYLISNTLASSPGGDLVDIGCGPGMMVRELLDTRPADFRITAFDRSAAMVKECAARAGGANNVAMVVAGMEKMPFRDASFDVALAMGVLEYADAGAALAEISRVLRPDGRLLATMLNPMSPYRLVEWHVYWPLLRMVGRVERWLHVPPDRRHGAADTGIRAYRERTFREMLVKAGMSTKDVVYYDVTVLVPPIDRVARRLAHGWHEHPERTVSRGWQKHFGTAFMVVATPSPGPSGVPVSHARMRGRAAQAARARRRSDHARRSRHPWTRVGHGRP
jgi:ubiquinone/menaquinone biosynthesis C-methylase UbiE